MFKNIITVIAFITLSTPAYAGFGNWTTEVEKDPFSGGVSVRASFSFSQRSQVAIYCDTANNGLEIVVLPGWEMTSDVESFEPEIKIAVDGVVIVSSIFGKISAYGENLAGSRTYLTKNNAEKLIEHFLKATRQIAIDDGMSRKPLLMNAKGSTATAKKLKQCYEAQKGATAPIFDNEASKEDRIAEIKSLIESLQQQLLELEVSQ